MGDSLGRFGDMTLWAKSYRMQRMPDRCQTDAKDRGWQLACGRERIRGGFGPWGSVGNGEHPVSGQKITDLDSHVTSCRCVTPMYIQSASSGGGFIQRDGDGRDCFCLLGYCLLKHDRPDFSFKPSPLHLMFCHQHATFLSAEAHHNFSNRGLTSRFLRLDSKTPFVCCCFFNIDNLGIEDGLNEVVV